MWGEKAAALRRAAVGLSVWFLLSLFGCGTDPLEVLRGDSGDTPTSDLDTLPASVIDEVPEEYADYNIIATTIDKASNLWDFAIRARQGVKGGLTFEWDFGDGQTYTGVSQTYTFPDVGTYVVVVTGREPSGHVAFVLSLQVEVVTGNQPPVADAGANQTANENQLVFLYGGGSFDPDNGQLEFVWSQLSGVPVQLLDKASPTARFVTPLVDADRDLAFSLSVSDGELAGRDAVAVTVLDSIGPAETGPTAKAGSDQEVTVGDLVTLNGSASVGPLTMTYQWSQSAGPAVKLRSGNSARATFVAPDVNGDAVHFVFVLMVTEGDLVDVDEVVVTVNPLGPRACDVDTDGDGTADCADDCIHDPNKTAPGVCGCGAPETDSDADSVPDCADQCPGEADADADGDGVVNCLDECPDDPNKTEKGTCGCGIADSDSDGDGTLDCAEECPPGSDGDADGDGVADCLDQCPNDAAKTAPGLCGCRVSEADSDGDSVPDCNDVCPGEADVDADHDGVLNCVDGCPNDPAKTETGQCGCGVADTDSDGDGTADCLEPSGCERGTGSWQNFAITPQNGTFTVRFDAAPNEANIDGLVGLSSGETGTFEDSAVTVRFNVDGFLDAWNPEGTKPWDPTTPGWYSADTVLDYTPGRIYHFRLEVNVPQHIYSVYVTPDGSTERIIAESYGFRGGQGSVSVLDHWSVWAGTGSHDVCDFVVGGCVADSDGDGVVDCQDGCPNNPAKTAPGVCGCAAPDTDTDADGVADCNDQCPGSPDDDADADGVADCVDVCPGFDDKMDSDGDGTPDGCELPALSVSVTALDFGFSTSEERFDVWNSGGGTLHYDLAAYPCGGGVWPNGQPWVVVRPEGGDSDGERDSVAVTVERAGLADGTYCGEIEVSSAASTVTILISMAVGEVGGRLPPPVIVASRTEGMSPLAVFFEGTASQDADGKSIENAGLFGTNLVEYTWTFERRTSSGTYVLEDTFSGFNAAYVFEPPHGPSDPADEPTRAGATYRVTLTVRDADRICAGGANNGRVCNTSADCPDGTCADQIASSNQAITVPAFSGKTYYVSSDGDDGNPGTRGPDGQPRPWRNYDKAFLAIRNNQFVAPGDRVLFRRGGTFPYTSSIALGSAQNVLLAAYGTGSKPLIQYAGTTGDNALVYSWTDAANVTLMDIGFDGQSHAPGNPRAFAVDSWMSNLCLLRVDLERYYNFVAYTDGLFVVDSNLADTVRQNIYYHGRRLAVRGSVLRHGPLGNGRHNIYGSVIDRGVISGSRFEHSTWAGLRIAANAAPGSSNVVVSDNEFTRVTSPIDLKVTNPSSMYTGNNILIDGNYVHDCGYGVRNQRSGYTDVLVRNNLMINVQNALILSTLYGGGPLLGIQGLKFYNNTIVSNTENNVFWIETSDHRNVDIRNNVIELTSSSRGSRAMNVVGGIGEVSADYNLFHLPNRGDNPVAFSVEGGSYTLDEWLAPAGAHANSLAGNPWFVRDNPGCDSVAASPFTLCPGSEAIDQGDSLPDVPVDFSSPPVRRRYGAYDMGCFERD